MTDQGVSKALKFLAEQNGLEDMSEEELWSLVEKLSLSEKKNQPIPTKILFDSYDMKGVAKYIKEQQPKNILVMTGAGISVAAGIPDFRTKGTGIYDNLAKYKLPYAEAIFDISYFKKNPKPFCVLAKEMWPSNFDPTPCHYFIKLLDEKGLLLRNYTQNIDTLERRSGMNERKVVEAHGCFANGHCIRCSKTYSTEFIREEIFKDKIPKCTSCQGFVKPDITFFGEGLPEKFHNLLPMDLKKADLLIVIGTSLVVHPFASIATNVSSSIPRILINMETAGPFSEYTKTRDVCLLGDCQSKIIELINELEWFEDFKKLIPEDSKSLKEALGKLEKPNKENNEKILETTQETTIEIKIVETNVEKVQTKSEKKEEKKEDFEESKEKEQ